VKKSCWLERQPPLCSQNPNQSDLKTRHLIRQTTAPRLLVKNFITLITLAVGLLAILPPAGLAADAKTPFTGAWAAKTTEHSAFSLQLTQKGDQLEGYHSAVAQKGNRIDSALPGEDRPSIKGTIVNGVALVQFRSGYSEATGNATLTLKDGKLEWKITKSSGVHYLPDTAVLTTP